MNLLDVISTPIHVVSPSDPVSHARNVMLKNSISRVLVTQKSDLKGILTKTDLARGLQQDKPKWKRRPIDSIPVKRMMSKDLITANSSDSIEKVSCLMYNNKISGVPIIEDGSTQITGEGEIIGIVTKFDLIKYFSEEIKEKKISNLYTEDVVSVHQFHSINRVIDVMKNNEIHRVMVEGDNGEAIGIITNSDLTFAQLNRPGEKGMAGNDLKMVRKESKGGRKEKRSIKKNMLVAKDIMSSPLFEMDIDEKASNIAQKMIEKDISGIPITKEDELVGIVTKTDFVKDLCEDEE